jgi:Mn-containing catalase
MFKHEKQLLNPVKIEKAKPQYAVLLQEQLGGAHGELKAAMQYISQSFRVKDQEIKDLFLISARKSFPIWKSSQRRSHAERPRCGL